MPDSSKPCIFPVTRWTLLNRVRAGTEAEARAALETLCCAYWPPLYCVARQKKFSQHDAQDTVQGFFESLLRRETFTTVDETLGKLRTLLLRAFDNYCNQQWNKANRQKRGSGAEHVELGHIDSDKAEQRFLKTSADSLSIEALYNREWAQSVLERSLEALRADYASRGWLERYELLVGSLLQQDDKASLEHLAKSNNTTGAALRVTLHRMRGHYREKIERELATTLDTDDPKEIREEMAELFKAFS